MSAPEPRTLTPWLRPVVDSRPPAHRFGDAGRTAGPTAVEESSSQPSLLDVLREIEGDASGPPRPRGVRIHNDTVPGAVEAAPGLPEPGAWTAVLGLAIGQTLIGARPVGQLDCWLEPSVLADLKFTVRERVRLRDRPRSLRVAGRALAVRVISVRVQLPRPTVVEAAVHLRIGDQSSALALRLQAYGRRWLCTALVRPEPVSDPRTARDTA